VGPASAASAGPPRPREPELVGRHSLRELVPPYKEKLPVKRIVAEPRKCLACRTCELACAVAHAESNDLVEALLDGARPRVYIEAAGDMAVPLQCRHCEDSPCVQVCPTAALAHPVADGPVLADPSKCIGCEFCVQVCPFGVIRVAEGRAVIKCDLCAERLERGLPPACVASCPVGALAWEEIKQDAARRRAQTAMRLVSGELS
jgi:anaerobic carbon-monoxide dehydrogenase iron sulfur subunit